MAHLINESQGNSWGQYSNSSQIQQFVNEET